MVAALAAPARLGVWRSGDENFGIWL